MSIDEIVSTGQTVSWQRDVSSFLSSMVEFLNAFDVDKLSNEQKTKALKSLQKLVPPSAPATDGGVSKAVRELRAEAKRMNNISFAGGHVVNNVMGIGLFPGEEEALGIPVFPSIGVSPDPHSHSIDALSHAENVSVTQQSHTHTVVHDHTGNVEEGEGHDHTLDTDEHDHTFEGASHKHAHDHIHRISVYGYLYDTTGPLTGPVGEPPEYLGAVDTGGGTGGGTISKETVDGKTEKATTGMTIVVEEDSGETKGTEPIATVSIPDHEATDTGDTNLSVDLE